MKDKIPDTKSKDFLDQWFEFMQWFKAVLEKGTPEQKKEAIDAYNTLQRTMKEAITDIEHKYDIDLREIKRKLLESQDAGGEALRNREKRVEEMKESVKESINKFVPRKPKKKPLRKGRMQRNLYSKE